MLIVSVYSNEHRDYGHQADRQAHYDPPVVAAKSVNATNGD